MSTTTDIYSPGATLRMTVARVPRREDQRQTIVRLMRQDPLVRKALRRAQDERKRTLVVRSRGGRPWPLRGKASKIARIEEGASWTMNALPTLQSDFASVAPFLNVEKA